MPYKDLQHFEVPDPVYIYIRQLENEIINRNGAVQRLYDFRFGEKQVKSETITDTRKLELLLTEIKSTAKRKTCYDGKGGGDYYEYSEDQDIIFDDGDRYGRITFARELLESIGESYE
jgi:hypothetical protein